jgi:hypothetical protein
MARGGARGRSGPAPDPNALRRDRKSDQAGWTTLPSEGRTAPTPRWPAPTQTEREAELWIEMWETPQALIWERDGLRHYVAMFVRLLAEAEVEKASAENRKTVRMMYADLYLTSDSMARARISIAIDETAAKRDEKASSAPKRSSARDRMTVVDGNGA